MKSFRASWPGKPFFVRSSTADNRGDKTSVRREGADGIPKFPRHAEICGRLPPSPPAESAGGTCRSYRPQYVCTEKRLPDMTPDGLQSKGQALNEQSLQTSPPMWGLRRQLSETKRKKSPLWRRIWHCRLWSKAPALSAWCQ